LNKFKQYYVYESVMKKLLVIMLLLSVSRFSLAVLTIEITKGSDSALPIAVVPFVNKTGLAISQDVSLIIANDLQRSGDFQTLPVSRMLSLPESMSQVHYRDWRMLGQSYVLVGNVQFVAETNKYDVSYELIEVVSQTRMAGEIVSTSERGLRKVAHYISDIVYEKIMGVKGAFSTKIAYITQQQLTKNKLEYRLQVADADGYGEFTLFKSHQPMLSPAWSNDGQHLVYVSFHSGRPAIYIQHVGSSQQRKITGFPGLNDSPMWSPDDKSLVMTLSKDGNAELYRYDLASSQIDRLTNHYRIDTEGSWSPDGKKIVFTSDRGGQTQVYEMGLNDLRPQRLTFSGSYNSRPRYSRDGQSIYYVHKPDNRSGGQSGFHIASIDIKTGNQRILTSTTLDESPSLSPNGRMIIYSTLRGDKKVLAVVSVDGGAKYFIPSSHGDVLEPAWSPFL
jgi:TolB protein